jgi:hypothetical protein
MAVRQGAPVALASWPRCRHRDRLRLTGEPDGRARPSDSGPRPRSARSAVRVGSDPHGRGSASASARFSRRSPLRLRLRGASAALRFRCSAPPPHRDRRPDPHTGAAVASIRVAIRCSACSTQSTRVAWLGCSTRHRFSVSRQPRAPQTAASAGSTDSWGSSVRFLHSDAEGLPEPATSGFRFTRHGSLTHDRVLVTPGPGSPPGSGAVIYVFLTVLSASTTKTVRSVLRTSQRPLDVLRDGEIESIAPAARPRWGDGNPGGVTTRPRSEIASLAAVLASSTSSVRFAGRELQDDCSGRGRFALAALAPPGFHSLPGFRARLLRAWRLRVPSRSARFAISSLGT